MASLNNVIRLCFANRWSDEFGLFVVSSLGSDSFASGDEKRSLVVTKSIYKETFDLHYVNDDTPLEFAFILVKSDGNYIDNNEERQIKKWLLKNKREWLYVEQDDMLSTYYYGIITQVEKININSYTGGYKIYFTCDSSHAWSGLNKKDYTCDTTLSKNIKFDFDYDDYLLYPQLTIKAIDNGNISIENATTNTEVNINNCVANEIIYLDCRNDKIKSSTNRVLIDDWNKNTISFKEGNNNLILTGNFNLSIEYRLPIRIGG